jgi:hypothetical protein
MRAHAGRPPRPPAWRARNAGGRPGSGPWSLPGHQRGSLSSYPGWIRRMYPVSSRARTPERDVTGATPGPYGMLFCV